MGRMQLLFLCDHSKSFFEVFDVSCDEVEFFERLRGLSLDDDIDGTPVIIVHDFLKMAARKVFNVKERVKIDGMLFGQHEHTWVSHVDHYLRSICDYIKEGGQWNPLLNMNLAARVFYLHPADVCGMVVCGDISN